MPRSSVRCDRWCRLCRGIAPDSTMYTVTVAYPQCIPLKYLIYNILPKYILSSMRVYHGHTPRLQQKQAVVSTMLCDTP